MYGHSSLIEGFAFNPEGRFLATAGWDQTVRVWDVPTGREVRCIRGHDRVVVLRTAFARRGARLVSVDASGAKVWDATTDQEARTLELSPSPDGCTALAFNADGSRLATGVSPLNENLEFFDVQIWDTSGGAVTASARLQGRSVPALAFSPDGRYLAAVANKPAVDRPGSSAVVVWNALTGRELFTFALADQPGKGVAFSRDGRYLAAHTPESVGIWDMTAGRLAARIEGRSSEGGFVWASFEPAGDHLLTADKFRRVRHWDPRTGETLSPPPDEPRGETAEGTTVLAFSADGSRAAVLDGQTGVVTIENDAGPPGEGPNAPRALHARNVVGASFNPDGRRLATAGMDRSVMIWDTATGKELLTFRGLGQLPQVIAFSPDGWRLAAGCNPIDPVAPTEVKVWDASPRRD
jgi:WD40 repeat protein